MNRIRNRLIAPVKNHHQYKVVRNFIINLLFVGVVCSYIVWSFEIKSPLRKGFGIAVFLTLLEYYAKLYYSIKK